MSRACGSARPCWSRCLRASRLIARGPQAPNGEFGPMEVLRAADALLTMSPAQSRSLVGALGVDPGTVRVVGAGTDEELLPRHHATAPALRHAHGFPASRRRSSSTRLPRRSGQPRGAHRRLRTPAEALRDSRQLVITGYRPEPAANRFSHLATAAASAVESSGRSGVEGSDA